MFEGRKIIEIPAWAVIIDNSLGGKNNVKGEKHGRKRL